MSSPGEHKGYIHRHYEARSDALLCCTDCPQQPHQRSGERDLPAAPPSRQCQCGRSRPNAVPPRRAVHPRLPRHAHLWPVRDLRPVDTVRVEARVGRAAAGGALPPALPAGHPVHRAGGPRRRGPEDDGARPGRRQVLRRDRHARQRRHEGVPQEPQGQRRGVRGRVVPLWRPRCEAPRWVHRGEGPDEGHHHLRRGEHQQPGGGEGAVHAPGGAGGLGSRQGRRAVGRVAVRVRYREGGN
uniref:Uncharacterized protein n=1 Tax=Arundo donax TaxID=35708 RepID=A0A0A9BL02_ARUDO